MLTDLSLKVKCVQMFLRYHPKTWSDLYIFDHWTYFLYKFDYRTLISIYLTIEHWFSYMWPLNFAPIDFSAKQQPDLFSVVLVSDDLEKKEYISQNTFMFIRQNEVFMETDTFVTLYIRAGGLWEIETPLSLYSLIRNHHPFIRNEFWSGWGCGGVSRSQRDGRMNEAIVLLSLITLIF